MDEPRRGGRCPNDAFPVPALGVLPGRGSAADACPGRGAGGGSVALDLPDGCRRGGRRGTALLGGALAARIATRGQPVGGASRFGGGGDAGGERRQPHGPAPRQQRHGRCGTHADQLRQLGRLRADRRPLRSGPQHRRGGADAGGRPAPLRERGPGFGGVQRRSWSCGASSRSSRRDGCSPWPPARWAGCWRRCS